jgi:hypothetical protein
MRTSGVPFIPFGLVLGAAFALTAAASELSAQTKPTGAPLVLSNIETEQPIPLASLMPDGKTAKCDLVRLHWISKPDVGPDEDAASFTLDLPADNPAAPIFLAQLWNASLASAMAWQEPWQGARWKVLDTPVTDGTGLDAALAVGMISTSARRPYPPKTVVIGSLNPDGSLGPVSHLMDRLDAAAKAGITRAIIPSVQKFVTDSSGMAVNVVKQAGDLGIECIPVDDLVTATETTMNDPLPDTTLDATLPKYSNEVTSYIDDFARREQTELAGGLKFAPKETDIASFPPYVASVWKSIYLDYESGQEAYGAGQVYVAYELFSRANGRMSAANALTGQTRTTFDVKAALAESDELHEQLRQLTSPPSIDHGDLQSAVVVAEMADWAYDLNAALEGAQLVTKQAFSVRSDATEAEKDRARQSILFANAECKYLLSQSGFYTRLLDHVAGGAPINVDANAEHLLPQLIPAQLAAARSFTDGIRASDLRDGLLFDPRLVAYVNVLRQVKTDWDAHQRKKQNADEAAAADISSGTNADQPAGPVQLNSKAPVTNVGFDPGNTYKPPSSVALAANPSKKLSDPALCLIWVNHDCEIATLSEKYLRLGGSMDPATHEWKVKDHAKLDALLQMAEIGARRGISFATRTGVDQSVLALIYEKATHERTRGSDAASLDALRNFWRCALLGNMCWQLAHTHKAEAVDLTTLPPPETDKTGKKGGNKAEPRTEAKVNEGTKGTAASAAPKTSDETATATPAASTNTVVAVSPQGDATTADKVVTPAAVFPAAPPVAPGPADPATAAVAPAPAPPVAAAASDTNAMNIPVAPIATNPVLAQPVVDLPPVAPPAPAAANPPVAPVAAAVAVNPPVAPIATTAAANPPVAPIATAVVAQQPTPPPPAAVAPDDANIPVAPIAKAADLTAADATTNAAPIAHPLPSKTDNADGHANAFP